ncbi:GDSL-like lipase/acylhydrolase family protein [Pedobacter psychrotolerans]|uniref:GDSL-like lipase/acylhydrolase family protein n=1 Tax=Pedobacter psychrotolerans TaxID=1843235 RepID=A0A4V2RZY6_9SPHI|nr:SGNH/GDSL hydrolase family protein [Pedobacter psychrotolerans]TCO28850.1 GDSL-like lipase/acylhydrolase family protein [Pedobacter psychrotolerans]GGE52265.1 hypothetical protein GCM10011413_18210 [Pedobacter psychrotolerans]
MIYNKGVVLITLFLLFARLAYSQQQDLDMRYKDFIDLETYMHPFWSSTQIVDETVMVIRDGEQNFATLLFPAMEITAVRSTDHSIKYINGKDWILKKGKLVILPGSKVPYFNRSDLVFTEKKAGLSMTGKADSSYVLFKEGLYFQSRQLAVTYKRQRNAHWLGPVPAVNKDALPNTRLKLKKRLPMKICFFGNSIEVGYNSSGLMNGAPYMPTWPELVRWKLGSHFQSEIIYSNPSVAGKMASWGAENVVKLAATQQPDLLIIGFGMNDGASQVSPDEYLKHIRQIIARTLEVSPATEFILLAPMLANPDATQNGLQEQYIHELKKLSGKQVVTADMTGVHRALLKRKNYQDMTGNNVNHPNDYLSRWYAQMICGIFIKSK